MTNSFIGGIKMSEFKISLAAARVNAGLSQKNVGKLLQKGKQTIHNWETGKTRIDKANLSMLCKLYGIDMKYIFLPN